MNLEERFLQSERERLKLSTGGDRLFYLDQPGAKESVQAGQEQMAEGMTKRADIAAGMTRGLATGFAGLPGDVLAIGRGLYELGKRGADETAADAFLRGLEDGTIVPTSEQIGKWLDDNVSPIVPEGAANQAERKEMAEMGTLIGEVAAPAGYVRAAKAVGKGAKRAAKAVTEKGAE